MTKELAIAARSLTKLGTAFMEFNFNIIDASRNPKLSGVDAFRIIGGLIWELFTAVYEILAEELGGKFKLAAKLIGSLETGKDVYDS